MVAHWPGPYSVEYKYTTTISSQPITHDLELNCALVGSPAPGTPVGSLTLMTKSGASLALTTGVNDVWNIIRGALGNTTVISAGYTVWRYVPGTLAKDFIAAGTVTSPNGASGVAAIAAAQTKLTFRSANGGIMQFNLLESSIGGNTISPLVPAGTGLWYVVLAAYALSASGWMLARDDGYPIAALNVAFGQNEALFERRFRQT